MKIIAHNSFQQPVEIQATSAVFRDDSGNIFCAVVQAAGGYEMHRLGDPGFQAALAMLGLEDKVELTIQPKERGTAAATLPISF